MDLQALKRRFGIIGNSAQYNRSLEVAVRVAPTDLTVLITGESGVGKEVFSKIIHNQSTRKHNNFIAVNCGAIPEGTIDSELFGHEKGSFTGAGEKRVGYFEFVDGGTIFLDEIGEMPLSTQSRLLRILESGEFMKVGSSKVLKTDVRVIAATNVDLQAAISKGKFREDLYYRLNTVPIKVPPLRERREDVYLLFRKFTVDFAEKHKAQPVSLSEEAQEVLKRFPWHGNIRELKNIAEQISVLGSDNNIGVEELQSFLPSVYNQDNLPVLAREAIGEQDFDMSERDIMYKLLFDMRKDLTELKKFVLQMAQRNGGEGNVVDADLLQKMLQHSDNTHATVPAEVPSTQPLVVHSNYTEQSHSNQFYPEQEQVAEEVQESLSLEDNEKELILKALKKHRGKRKNAAEDLGISERTLYRKIKQYDLQE